MLSLSLSPSDKTFPEEGTNEARSESRHSSSRPSSSHEPGSNRHSSFNHDSNSNHDSSSNQDSSSHKEPSSSQKRAYRCKHAPRSSQGISTRYFAQKPTPQRSALTAAKLDEHNSSVEEATIRDNEAHMEWQRQREALKSMFSSGPKDSSESSSPPQSFCG